MDKVFQFFFGKKFLLLLILATSLVFAVSLWHRFIYIDDCWHGEEAYWLAKDGVVKTKSMEGILGFENKVMVYHKLNVILGAAVIKVFGWSVYNLKLITLFFYLAFFYCLFRFIRHFRGFYQQEHFILAAFFIFVNPLMVHLGFTFRPEILAMFFGFLSYFTLELFLQTDKNKWLVLSAILAGLAFFTHLNAMIFGISGFVLLLFFRKFKAALLFTLITLLTCMLYTFDLWQGDNFQIFKYQIENWPTLKLGTTYFDNNLLSLILHKAQNLVNEQQRFFWSDKVFAFSAIFIFALLYGFKMLRTKYRSLLIYTLALIFSLNLTGSHIAERFLIYYYPFMALIVAIVILNIINNPGKYFAKSFLLFALLAHLVFVGVRFADIFHRNGDFPAIHRQLSQIIDDSGAKVLAPDQFVFNEIENRPILSYHVWEYYEDISGEKLTQETALMHAYNLGAKYIILDEEKLAENNRWFASGIIATNPYFHSYKKYLNYLILKRND